MFQLGSKFVGKGSSKEVFTVVEVKPQQNAYVGESADGQKRIFAASQMVSVSQSTGHRLGSF